MSFAVSPAARADVLATSADLDRQPGRLGTAFEAEVEAALDRIAATPQLFSPAEDAPPAGEYREFFIDRFQQRVTYRVTGGDVLIVAVTHASRRPGAWHRRLPADPPETT